MTWESALESIVARTGHLRFRALCADGHPDHPAWRRRVIEMATGNPTPPGPAPARPDVAASLARTRAMNACPFRSRGPGCGCSGAACSLRKGSIVSHLDCFACVEAYGP